jgi:hypothetical protein
VEVHATGQERHTKCEHFSHTRTRARNEGGRRNFSEITLQSKYNGPRWRPKHISRDNIKMDVKSGEITYLTAVTTDSTVFSDVMPCTVVEIYKCFGGIYGLYHQDRRIN